MFPGFGAPEPAHNADVKSKGKRVVQKLTNGDRKWICLRKSLRPDERFSELQNAFRAERNPEVELKSGTVSGILKASDKWLAIADGQETGTRTRASKEPELEQALFLWRAEQIVAGVVKVRDEDLRDKARELAAYMGINTDRSTDGLSFSSGWLDRFKKRNQIKQATYKRKDRLDDPGEEGADGSINAVLKASRMSHEGDLKHHRVAGRYESLGACQSSASMQDFESPPSFAQVPSIPQPVVSLPQPSPASAQHARDVVARPATPQERHQHVSEAHQSFANSAMYGTRSDALPMPAIPLPSPGPGEASPVQLDTHVNAVNHLVHLSQPLAQHSSLVALPPQSGHYQDAAAPYGLLPGTHITQMQAGAWPQNNHLGIPMPGTFINRDEEPLTKLQQHMPQFESNPSELGEDKAAALRYLTRRPSASESPAFPSSDLLGRAQHSGSADGGSPAGPPDVLPLASETLSLQAELMAHGPALVPPMAHPSAGIAAGGLMRLASPQRDSEQGSLAHGLTTTARGGEYGMASQ